MDKSNMKRIASSLYCRSICQEFRRPVDALYPTIMSKYMTVVRTPMDLGTILYDTIHEHLTVEQFRVHVQLVFDNAIAFNVGVPLMEAMSSHIDSFAGGLFEEILNREYRPVGYLWESSADLAKKALADNSVAAAAQNKSMQSYSKQIISDFKLLRLARRRFRFANCKDMVLNDSEMRILVTALQRGVEHMTSTLFQSYMRRICSHLENLLNSIDGKLKAPTLSSLFKTIINDVSNASLAAPLGSNTPRDITQPAVLNVLQSKNLLLGDSDDPTDLIHPIVVNSMVRNSLEILDECLGELLVFLQERKYRGSQRSSVWASPYHIVWTQPPKHATKDKNKASWWAGVIVGGGKGSNVPKSVNDINFSRIPSTFVNQLLRPKVQPKASKPSSAMTILPDGTVVANEIQVPEAPVESPQEMALRNSEILAAIFCKHIPPTPLLRAKYEKLHLSVSTGIHGSDQKFLVEFFGAHDFGWVRTDSIIPFTKTAPGQRGCSQEAVEEATQMYAWTKKLHSIVDSASVVADSEMTDIDCDDCDIEFPLLTELEESIRHPPRPEYEPPKKRRPSTAGPSHESDLSGANATNHENSSVYPPFEQLTLEESRSKFSRAVARSKALSIWMNTAKPICADVPVVSGKVVDGNIKPTKIRRSSKSDSISSPKGENSMNESSSPFSPSATASDNGKVPDADSLMSLPAPSSRKRGASDINLSANELADLNSMKDDVSHDTINNAVEQTTPAPKRSKPSKAVDVTSHDDNAGNSGRRHSGTTIVCNISTPSSRIYAGEGIVHSKIIDFNSSLFFYEDRKRDYRKEILRSELNAIANALKRLQNASSERERLKEKFLHSRPPQMSLPSSLPTLPINLLQAGIAAQSFPIPLQVIGPNLISPGSLHAASSFILPNAGNFVSAALNYKPMSGKSQL